MSAENRSLPTEIEETLIQQRIAIMVTNGRTSRWVIDQEGLPIDEFTFQAYLALTDVMTIGVIQDEDHFARRLREIGMLMEIDEDKDLKSKLATPEEIGREIDGRIDARDFLENASYKQLLAFAIRDAASRLNNSFLGRVLGF